MVIGKCTMKLLHLVSIILAITGSYAEGSLRNRKEHTHPEDEWWENQPRSLQSSSCPAPDTFTSNLPFIRTGQYGSASGDCFYIYWDPTKCSLTNKCPLYVYVDGTTYAGDIDDRDYVFMEQMAARGYVAVTVDYDDSVGGYSGCSSFNEKSSKIFDESVEGTVLHQLCRDTTNLFDHGPNVPVDCDMGVAVNGWSQGAHIAALGAAHSPDGLVTGALLWGNGNNNQACLSEYPNCFVCITTDVSCMNDADLSLSLPREKRRSIVGDEDTYFGACGNLFGANSRANVVAQQRDTSGYACPDDRDDCMRRLPEGCNNYGMGEQTCIDPSSENFGRQYTLSCPLVCNDASPCGGLNSGACPAFIEPEDTAGYYVIPEKPHNFMDTNSGSDFMTDNVLWGLHVNFDWLAEVSRVSGSTSKAPTSSPLEPTNNPTASPSKLPTSSPHEPTNNPTASPSKLPTNNPTASPSKAPTSGSPVLPGFCSDSTGRCSESDLSQCGCAAPVRKLQACAGLKNRDCTNAPLCVWAGGSGCVPTPTLSPSVSPTTQNPTRSPSSSPTESPSKSPTKNPTLSPSSSPTKSPVVATSPPTRSPTNSPVVVTSSPTESPTTSPSKSPTKNPTHSPTESPVKSTNSPTTSPSKTPTSSCGCTSLPSESPTTNPTSSPSAPPTKSPTTSPSASPTRDPTAPPSKSPSQNPTSNAPTASPSSGPSKTPSSPPTSSPSNGPSNSPTANPVNQCLAKGSACTQGQEAECCAKTCTTRGQNYKCD